MTTSIIAYLILRYGFGMDDPETFMKSMGFGVIAGIARLVYINHKREQEIEADAATESSTATTSSTYKTIIQTTTRKAACRERKTCACNCSTSRA